MTQNKSVNYNISSFKNNLKTKHQINTSYKEEGVNSGDSDNFLDYSIILQKMPTDLLIHIISNFLTPLIIDAFVVTSTYHFKLRVPIWNNCLNIYFPINTITSNTEELETRAKVWKHWQKRLIISATLEENKVKIMNNSIQWWDPIKPCFSSKFNKVACCHQVCWFDISFEKNIAWTGMYKVYLRIQHINRDSCVSMFKVSVTKSIISTYDESFISKEKEPKQIEDPIKKSYIPRGKIISQYDPRNNNNWNPVNCNGCQY
jgi:hypothetical protein